MKTSPAPDLYKRHRFPAEIISHCVWLYFRFCLSYRDVEELMMERGATGSYAAVRYWCRKFGQTYANQVRRCQPRAGDKWHLDEVFLSIHGVRHTCGGPWIRTATSSISWSSVGGINRPRRNSSASC